MTCPVILVKSARNDLPLTIGLQWPSPPALGHIVALQAKPVLKLPDVANTSYNLKQPS